MEGRAPANVTRGLWYRRRLGVRVGVAQNDLFEWDFVAPRLQFTRKFRDREDALAEHARRVRYPIGFAASVRRLYNRIHAPDIRFDTRRSRIFVRERLASLEWA